MKSKQWILFAFLILFHKLIKEDFIFFPYKHKFRLLKFLRSHPQNYNHLILLSSVCKGNVSVLYDFIKYFS